MATLTRALPLSLAELSIDTTLRCGQSFRWRKIKDEWSCALHGRILSLRQDATHLHYRVTWPTQPSGTLTPPPSPDDSEDLLRHYLSLKLDLGALYDQWSRADPNFRKKAPEFAGVRILSQDAWEALICFICSSNNNISRISQMVHKLCLHYGPLIGHIDDEPFHDFPTPQSLTSPGVESHLRELGFGYRAKYIADTARIVALERPKGWLASLTNPRNPSFGSAPPVNRKKQDKDRQSATYKYAHEELLQLAGVGPKVADCVCLMGLSWGEAVPVDTHVWQIAQRDYKFGKGGKTKTFNKVMYDAVGDHFRDLWGEYAGWAHSVLFTADLKAFADRSPAKKSEPEVKGRSEDESPTKRIIKVEAKVVVEGAIEVKDEEKMMVKEVVARSKRRRTVKLEDEKSVAVVTVTQERSSKRTRRTR